MLGKDNLHAYQVQSVEHVISVPKSGLFLEMGLGKTVSTLTAIKTLMYEMLEVSSVLIVAPKRVAENTWTDEIQNWRHLKDMTCSVICGNPKQRKEAIRKRADIHLISRDNFAWLVGFFGGSHMPYDMLVIDESSSFKSPKSVRFKAMRQVLHCFDRVVLLTGTPAPQSLMDLWPQLYILDRGERLGKTITAYRRDYFTAGQSNGHVVFNYKINKGANDEIHKRIADICISMKSKDYLDMPDARQIEVPVQLTDELKDKYKEFEKEKVLDILETLEEGEGITAANAAGLSNKLLQFANGSVYDEYHNSHHVHDLKLDALAEIVEAAQGEPILVAWSYRSDRDRILERFKSLKPRCLDGGQDIKDWNARKIKMLLMHPASGGHGLNLQKGGHIIVWFGNTWALELLQQFNARLDRQGQTEKVFIYKLVTKGTWDDKVVAAQKRKAIGQNELMNAVKAKMVEYGRI